MKRYVLYPADKSKRAHSKGRKCAFDTLHDYEERTRSLARLELGIAVIQFADCES